MIEVRVEGGWYVVTMPKAILVMTKAEFIQALRRGKWWARRRSMAARLDRLSETRGAEGEGVIAT